MERKSIDQFMLLNAGNFKESDLTRIQNELGKVPDENSTLILGTEFKKPTIALIISFLGGSLGIDRFYLGQTGKGILKLITCGGFSIWAIIDLFLIMGATKEYNTNKLIGLINVYARNQKAPEQNTLPSTPTEEISEVSVTDNSNATAPAEATDNSRYMPTSEATEATETSESTVVEEAAPVSESIDASIEQLEKCAQEAETLAEQPKQAE